jgi:hypothetical protein
MILEVRLKMLSLRRKDRKGKTGISMKSRSKMAWLFELAPKKSLRALRLCES